MMFAVGFAAGIAACVLYPMVLYWGKTAVAWAKDKLSKPSDPPSPPPAA